MHSFSTLGECRIYAPAVVLRLPSSPCGQPIKRITDQSTSHPTTQSLIFCFVVDFGIRDGHRFTCKVTMGHVDVWNSEAAPKPLRNDARRKQSEACTPVHASKAVRSGRCIEVFVRLFRSSAWIRVGEVTQTPRYGRAHASTCAGTCEALDARTSDPSFVVGSFLPSFVSCILPFGFRPVPRLIQLSSR